MKQALPPKKPIRIPKRTLGAHIDRLAELEKKITDLTLKYGQAVTPLRQEYDALEAHLIEKIPKDKLSGAAGAKASVSIDHPTYPTAKSWPKLYAYIAKEAAWDLLQRRLSVTAFRERWDKKKVIPGVEQFRDTKLKLTLKKK